LSACCVRPAQNGYEARISQNWTIREAIQEIAPKEFDAWCIAQKNTYGMMRVNPNEARYQQILREYAVATSAVEGLLRRKLKSGELVATGREGNPLTEPKKVPSSAWDLLQFVSWERSIAKHRGSQITLYDVRIAWGKGKAPRAKTRASYEAACEEWLLSLVKANLERPIAKSKLKEKACAFWKGLSEGRFDSAWDRATKDAPAWRRSGRRRASDRVIPGPP
jgi:hypothetical protein